MSKKEQPPAQSQEGWVKRKAKKAGNDILLLDRQAQILGGIKKDMETIAASTKTRRHETFEAAIERLNLSETDLANRYKNLCTATRVMHFGGVIMVGFLLFAAWEGNILQFLSAASIATICFVGGSLNAFRAWQIERRALGGFEEWLRSPQHWTK